jgi:hypothetical protein
VLETVGKSDAQERDSYFAAGYARRVAADLLERFGRKPDDLRAVAEKAARAIAPCVAHLADTREV